MKKLLSLLLVAAMLLTLAACGGKNENPGMPADNTASTPATTPESSTGQEIQPEATPSPEPDSTPATPPENAITLYNGDYIVPSEDPYEIVTLPLSGKPLNRETLTVEIAATISDRLYGPLELTLGGEMLLSGGVDANADSLIRTFEYMYGDETLERITNEWVAAPHSYKTCEYLPNAMALAYNDTDQTLNVLEALPYYYRAVNIGPDNNATPSFDGQKIESLADVISVYGDPVSASCKGSAFLYYVWTFGEDSAIIAECTPPMKLLPDGRLNEMHYIRYNHIPIEGDDYGPTYENILAVLADMGLYDAPVE